MNTTFDAGANRLGAFALRITDRLHAALAGEGARSLSDATALAAIHNFLDAPSIDELRRVLGLTSSATVRLVDRLEADGLATRTAGADGRVSHVALTRTGRRVARRLVDARAQLLVEVLDPLTPAERATFAGLLDKVLVPLVRTPTPSGWMCRLCDTATCGAPRGGPCPVTLAGLGP